MKVIEKYDYLIENLYKISNPILKLKIENDLLNKNLILNQEITNNELFKYWLNIFDGKEIHGSKDHAFENSIGKLLEFGLSNKYIDFDKRFNIMLEDKYWNQDSSFYSTLFKTVLYPFLTRAGYFENQKIKNFFYERIETIERTISKYGYDFKDFSFNRPKNYLNEFVFHIDITNESLPTIYDLYAFSFYPYKNDNIWDRIEKIVEYLLDKRFQEIPDNSYVYDKTKKRYYAAGCVYHACFKEYRKLLFIYLLSNFNVAKNSELFLKELKELLSYQMDDGYFIFDKSLIMETKNTNILYNGSHMGLGEDRRKPEYRRIESTFWMLKILVNLEKNDR